MARVLVLGASGLVGRALMQRLPGDAVGTYASRPFPGGVRFDALSDRLDGVLALDQFTHAVVLSGLVNAAACATDPVASRRLNVTAIGAILEALGKAGVVAVYTSSEVVFDGQRGAYRESDDANPLFLYAKQKLEVERLLAAAGADHVVARLGRVYGSDPGDGTLFTELLAHVRANATIRCAVDQRFSPLHANEAADAIALLVEHGHLGLFHVAGPRAVTRRGALELVLDEFRRHGGVFDGVIEDMNVDDLPTTEPRPRDVSLDIAKVVSATGLRLRDPADWCREIVAGALPSASSGK